MTPDDVLALLRSAVQTVLEIDPQTVTLQTRFVEDLKADSLALVEIVEILEEQVGRPGFRIDDEDLDALETVGQAVAYALARL